MAVEVLSVSSKGQVVLPMEMRKKMSIENGSKLAAYSIGDMIILKPISVPSEQDFKESLDKAVSWAKEVGYEQEDVNDIIKSYRKANKT